MSALDELRFGPQRTLNLRESLPGADEAARRAEKWLREHQVRGSAEVLIITGRGSQSVGGIPVVKAAVLRLLRSLQRQGVVASHREHNPGALAVTLAPLRALADAPARRREPIRVPPAFDFTGLEDATVALLRDLAQASLAALGIAPDAARVRDEMHRQLGLIAPTWQRAGAGDAELRETLRRMIADYD